MVQSLTSVQIASAALINIGQRPISSFETSGDSGILASAGYELTRDTLLSMYPWTFTLHKAKLSVLNNPPLNEYPYRFALPGDRVSTIRAVYNSGKPSSRSTPYGWEISGNHLLASHPEVWVDYQRLITEAAMPSYFQLALVYALSALYAEAATDQLNKAAYWDRLAYGGSGDHRRGGQIGIAIQIDGQGQSTQSITDFPLLSVRG